MSAGNIIAFVDLLEKKPELFSEHQTSLWELSESDLGAISKKITRWCKDRNVYDEFLEMLPDAPNHTKGPGGRENIITEKQAKELLDNAIRKSIPDKPNNNDQNQPSSKTSQS